MVSGLIELCEGGLALMVSGLVELMCGWISLDGLWTDRNNVRVD